MPRGSYLTEREKEKIEAYLFDGINVTEISRRIRRSRRVIANFVRKGDLYGCNKTGGPKKKLSYRDKSRISRLVSNKTISLRNVASQIENKVSKTTVWRAVKQMHYIKRQKPMMGPKLTENHLEQRRKFAKNYMRTDFSKVTIFYF